MFTGLVQTTGIIVKRIQNGAAGKLMVRPAKSMKNLEPGESVAVNGTCLTLENDSGGILQFHVMEESFRKTNLGILPPGAGVNMERALTLSSRLGGHLVSGHIDTTGTVLSFGPAGSDIELLVELPDAIADFVVPEGSICIDGVSLTVAAVDFSQKRFSVRIIPTTWKETCLKERKVGSKVNLEADMLGKYVHFQLERMAHKRSEKSSDGIAEGSGGITMDDLLRAGF